MSSKVIHFYDVPVYRLDSVEFGRKPVVFEHNITGSSDVFVEKVVDDSSYTPNSNYIRSVLASGKGSFTQGVYDFKDGVDNGFTPSMRSLSMDMAEIDQAANSVIADAKSKAEAKKASEAKAKSDERTEKILNNLASLSDDSGDSASVN